MLHRCDVVGQIGIGRHKDAQQRQQNAYEATAPSDKQELLREVGPWLGVGAGLLLGKMTRGGAVRQAAAKATEQAAKADALLTSGALGRGMGNPKGLTSRAANLNEFWRMGGSEGQVPFKTLASGETRPRGGAMDPNDLFPVGAKHFRSNDVGMMGSGLAEAGVSGTMLLSAQAEVAAAQDAADKDPSEANLARLERAKDMAKVAETAARFGLGFAGGRAFGALQKPYVNIRPNIAGAEAERALLLDAIRKVRGP